MDDKLEPFELKIEDDWAAAEFRVATHQALVNNLSEFEFQGFIVATDDAVNVVQRMNESVTFH